MGKRRSTSPVGFEDISLSDFESDDCDNYQRKKVKRSRKQPLASPHTRSSEDPQYENIHLDRKRRKHQKRKHHHNSQKDGSSTDDERSASHSRQRHKHNEHRSRSTSERISSEHEVSRDDAYIHKNKHHRSRSDKRRRKNSSVVKQEIKEEQDIPVPSRWEDDTLMPRCHIKEEPSSPNLRRRKKADETFRRTKIKKEKSESDRWGKADENRPKEEANPEDKQKVDFGLSGKLTEDANTYNGITIKYSQPQEARKPKRRWRWYIFKGEQEIPFLPLHRQSAYLIGRERKVADIPTDHPSCSKQHAVLQYRLVDYQRVDGSKGRTVKPYIIDLESANGTYLNNKRIDSKRYFELIEKDVVKFGYSSREYVLLHEGSKGDDDEGVTNREGDLSPISLLQSAMN